MTRPLHSATNAALNNVILPLALIVRLDIEGDPLYTWTGIGDLTFPPGSTGDQGLDGQTFTGTGEAIQVGSVTDAQGGSDALELTLAGVSITHPMLRQLIFNHNRWQFKRAIVWMVVLEPSTMAIVGRPFRIKTGRIDQMPYSESKGEGIVRAKVEGQQAYGDQALMTRYSEQMDVDNTDNSQSWIYSLANMTANFGTPSAQNTYNPNSYDFNG